MQIQIKEHISPQDHCGYIGKELIGTMASTQLWNAQGVCQSIIAPWRQLDHLGRKLHPTRPFYRSEEWVDDAIQALEDWDIFEN
jgi:hypothetical protein